MATKADDDWTAPRPVSLPLAIGILLLPMIFAWLLLRDGHGVPARVIGFIWLGFTLIVAFAAANMPLPL
jgi:hypothetical protein